MIFRFLHHQQWIGFRIVQKNQICKHFDCSVRHITCDEWILEASVLKAKHKPPILRGLCFNHGDSGHSMFHRSQDLIKALSMMLEKIICNERQIVSSR
ncbi:hypothetical protein WL96_18990 [Burkholderia vietnamiensis]|nr:hypothetical protein WL96_18990 [Burkholderia vietnamiensis]